MISKKIHLIWIQDKLKIPKYIKNKVKHLEDLNPKYKVTLWTKESIEELLKEYPKLFSRYQNVECLEGMENPIAIQSDIARYVIMYVHGGLYMDMDFVCTRSFDELFSLDYDISIASSEIDFLNYIYPFDKPKYCSCFMIFSKTHPIWKKVFTRIEHAKVKRDIDSALDYSLQESKYKINVLDSIQGHYDCDTKNPICKTPTESSWNIFRPLLKTINCNYELIFGTGILAPLAYYIYHS